jgi:hypothetical protein
MLFVSWAQPQKKVKDVNIEIIYLLQIMRNLAAMFRDFGRESNMEGV